MPIQFKKITIKNFLSYGNNPTEVLLDRPGKTTFVVGEDMDDTSSGTKGNGVGKTAVLNALVFAVYNKPVSNISMEKLVNNVNLKDMEVTVEFEKDGQPWAIRRSRKGKTGADVTLYEGKKDVTPDSIKLTSEKIEKIMGVPYELFVRIVAFSANHRPFLDLPKTHATQANQKDIIEELFEIKILSERAADLKEEIKKTNSDIKLESQRIEQLREEHKRHQALIDGTKARITEWKTDIDDERETILTKLDKIKGIDIKEQNRFHSILGDYNEQLQTAQFKQRDLIKTIKGHAAKMKQDKDELAQLLEAKCPYCKQPYHDNEWKIVEKENEIDLTKAEIEKQGDALVKEDTNVDTIEENIKEINNQIEVNNISELMEIQKKQAQYEDRLKHLEDDTNPHIATLKELEDAKLDKIDTTKLEELEDDLVHQQFLLKSLTKKDSFVRKKLLNSKLPFLNQRLASYLEILGLPHAVRFTEEMTVTISRFGRQLDFGNLSNGQQARLNFALSLAFRDMLEKVHGKINVYMLDEVLDVGLDTIGVSTAARLLKQKARDENLSIYIISHKDELSNAFDHKMTVKMSKGFSYIEE